MLRRLTAVLLAVALLAEGCATKQYPCGTVMVEQTKEVPRTRTVKKTHGGELDTQRYRRLAAYPPRCSSITDTQRSQFTSATQTALSRVEEVTVVPSADLKGLVSSSLWASGALPATDRLLRMRATLKIDGLMHATCSSTGWVFQLIDSYDGHVVWQREAYGHPTTFPSLVDTLRTMGKHAVEEEQHYFETVIVEVPTTKYCDKEVVDWGTVFSVIGLGALVWCYTAGPCKSPEEQSGD